MVANGKGVKSCENYVSKRLEMFKEYCNNNENVEIKLNSVDWQGVLYNLDDMKLLDKITINQELENANDDVYMFKYDSTKSINEEGK